MVLVSLSPDDSAVIIPTATMQSKKAATVFMLASIAAAAEIVEQRHTVGFRPDADHARVSERLVVPLDGFLSVKGDGEMFAVEVRAQRVPLAGRNFHVRSLLLGAFA